MPTILLEQIIALLTDWKDSFFIWANAIGDKIASIKTNTDSLPDIKDNTDDIKDNTAAVITPISNINTNISSISGDTASIRTDAGIIKNNAQAIATSSGQAAAFAQDCANNTLEVKNKVITIASDTTQIRADSGSIRSDVSDIKTAMTYYIANTIVTEDAEGSIANFDTDLQDYLQNAVVTIPADANGISGINISKLGMNLWDEETLVGGYRIGDGSFDASLTGRLCSKNMFRVKPGSNVFWHSVENITTGNVFFYDIDKNFISGTIGAGWSVISIPNNCYYMNFTLPTTYGTTYNNDVSINSDSVDHDYNSYNAIIQAVTFTAPITDGAEVDLLSGIVKINTSPVTYDSITPLAIRTYKGVNNIYSDIGDIDVTYRETLKHYLEKQQ